MTGVDRAGRIARSPLVWRAVNALGAPFGTVLAQLDADTLLAAARRDTGLDDFGDGAFRGPLEHILRACREEARLNFIGRFSAAAQTRMLLATRLRLLDARRRDPAIATQTIRRPIVITGLPRSGTTLLHRLIACDPASRSPLTWEAMYPVAPARGPDDRIRKAEGSLRWLDRLAPGFRAIHAVGATHAQECIALTAYGFESSQFHTTYDLPSYERWLVDHDPAHGYDMHRIVLQHLQAADAAAGKAPARWVLKAPVHVFHLARLVATYPDACLIQCHRDPVRVIGSVASLTAVLRRAFSDHIDGPVIGTEVLTRWAEGMRRSMAFRDAATRIYDLAYDRLMADPLAVVRDIYAHFDLELTPDAEAAMQGWLAANPQNRFGRHDYALAPFALEEDQVRAAFRDYCDFFGIGRTG